MESLLSKSFKVTRRNLIFLQLLLLDFLLSLLVIPYIIGPGASLYIKSILAFCVILFSIAIMAGLFYIDKKAVDDYNENDTNEETYAKAIKNLKLFFEGTGANFFKILFGMIILGIIYVCTIKGLYVFCTNHFGVPDYLLKINEINQIENMQQMKDYVLSIDQTQANILGIWMLLLMVVLSILNFFALLYLAVLTSETKNFIICFVKTIVYFFKNIITSVFIMVFMFALYIFINILVAFLGTNTFTLALVIFLVILYLNYYIILVLCFYNDKAKSNSDSGTECIGENQSCG